MSYLFNGNVNVLNEVEVKNDTGEPLAVEVVNAEPISVNLDNPISFGASATDAFGRLRVSNPFTLFDSQHRYSENDKWSTSLSGSGDKLYNANASLVIMRVGTASGDEVVRESKRIMAYQPGKSLLIFSTFQLSTPKTNLRQRVGYFSSTNGIYLQVNNTTVSFVLRGSSSGSLLETVVNKSSWNYDRLDGTGPSGYTITDFSNSMILFFDMEWLGVGDVRCGFVLNGQFIVCHIFKNTPAGGSPISDTYMTTACLPLRLEITNTGVTASSSDLKHICNSVISEAGYDLTSTSFHQNIGTTELRLSDADVPMPVISLRLSSSRLDSIIILKSLSIVLASNQILLYEIRLNPTLTDPDWNNHSCLSVDYDLSATAVTGGTTIAAGYIDKAGGIQLGSTTDFNFQLGRTLAGVSDIISLVCTPTSGNTDVFADLGWYKII